MSSILRILTSGILAGALIRTFFFRNTSLAAMKKPYRPSFLSEYIPLIQKKTACLLISAPPPALLHPHIQVVESEARLPPGRIRLFSNLQKSALPRIHDPGPGGMNLLPDKG